MKRVIGISFLLAGCASPSSPDSKLVTLKIEVSRIERVCKLPAGTIVVKADQEVRLRPRPTEAYQNVDCALSELKSSKIASYASMGFVGNERYDENLQ